MASSKQQTCLPPFEQADQLNIDRIGDKVDNSALTTERNQLLATLRDNDLEEMHKQLCGLKTHCWDWTYWSDVICDNAALHQAACGFLLSYTSLIRYPSDLEIAQATGLLDRKISWRSWQAFRTSVLHHLADRNIHDRFEYGELRLGRLNQIYRMKGMGLTYFNVYRDYSSYFGENYTSLVAIFAVVSVALSAMQVMAAFDFMPAVAADLLSLLDRHASGDGRKLRCLAGFVLRTRRD